MRINTLCFAFVIISPAFVEPLVAPSVLDFGDEFEVHFSSVLIPSKIFK